MLLAPIIGGVIGGLLVLLVVIIVAVIIITLRKRGLLSSVKTDATTPIMYSSHEAMDNPTYMAPELLDNYIHDGSIPYLHFDPKKTSSAESDDSNNFGYATIDDNFDDKCDLSNIESFSSNTETSPDVGLYSSVRRQ